MLAFEAACVDFGCTGVKEGRKEGRTPLEDTSVLRQQQQQAR
jgi:hypothetical protein